MAEPRTAKTTGAQASSEEVQLRDHLRRVADAPAGFFAIHLHLSELRPANRKPRYLTIAARAFEIVLTSGEATLYQLSNSDVVMVCRDTPIDEIDNAIAKVRALFSEDPLTAAPEGSLEDHFTTWYDLSQTNDLGALLAIATRLASAAQGKTKKDGEAQAMASSGVMTGDPLSPRNLAAINQKLETSRIADLIRRQTAVMVGAGGMGKVLFREHFVSMIHLQKRIAPGVNLFGSPWLFQYLTETLDRRVLLVIAKRGLAEFKDPISLNLNISTVLSREFQQFHRVAAGNADKLVVELQMIDVLADLTAYYFARDTLRTSGYRVLVDAVPPMALHYFDPAQLDADFIKIAWSREYMGEADAGGRDTELFESIRDIGSDRVVLARVDSQEAIKWGLKLGIQRYQGHFVDRLVEAMAAKGII